MERQKMKESPYLYRSAEMTDEAFLWDMLALAAQEENIEAVRANPALSRYVAGWNPANDISFVAVDGTGPDVQEKPITAIWLRTWNGETRGFGYVDAATPELAMAVLPEYRGLGVGTALLNQLIHAVAGRYPTISLCVRAENPVVRLYESAGFERIEGSETVNRVGSNSSKMIKRW
jgi:ribosomal protein S18 acetylase RimI-like enzyme